MVEYLKYTPELANDWKNAFSYTKKSMPYVFDRVVTSCNASQLQSKLWIIKELMNNNIEPKNICLVAGWYSQYIVPLLKDNFPTVDEICNYEIDKDIVDMSYKFNKRYKDNSTYKIRIKNIMFKSIDGDFDTVINCSCEHMFPMWKFREINKDINPIYVLQSSNDDTHAEHINCVTNEEELINQAHIDDVMYSGSIELINGTKRFMVIGK